MNTDTNPNEEMETEGKRAACCLSLLTPRDIFQIVAAGIVLFWLGSGVFDLIDSVLSGMGTYEVAPGRAKFLAASGSSRIVFSCLMLRNASALAAWVFPHKPSGMTSKDAAPKG
jgi:hypothetical protein